MPTGGLPRGAGKINGTYDLSLVALSFCIAVFASYVALNLASRVSAAQGDKARRYWLAGGAVSMGTGIWSMHFIGMLAFRLPIPMSYDIPTTLASLAIAIVVSGFALVVVSRGALGARRLAGGGVLMGLGIASMHYSGMAAMQMFPPLRYDPIVLAASVAIAIVASIAALWIAFQLRAATQVSAVWKKAGSALLMGSAIIGMHYTGMAAADFAADSICLVSDQGIHNERLAGIIAGFAFVLLFSTLLISVFDARLADRSARLAAELAGKNALLQHEVQERAQAEMAMRESEQRYRATFEQAAIAIAHISVDRRYLTVNPKFCELVGYTREELLAKRSEETTHPEDRNDNSIGDAMLASKMTTHSAEKRYVRKDGKVIWVNRTVSLARDAAGVPLYFIRVVEDITPRKAAEERLAYLAQYDSLTGLPNRSLFRDRLAFAMARARRSGRMLALMFLDLDHFKEINDTLGHATGDSVLEAAAGLLNRTLRDVDTVARLGGDEFTIILENIDDASQVSTVAEKIKRAFAAPLLTGERDIFVSASIGITLYPDDADNIEALLQAADVAMYHAKHEGRDTHEFYAPGLNARAAGHLHMESLLRRALKRDEFVLHYQPIVETRGGRITGAEALIRWNSPELGFVSPAQFIPLAERSGLVVPIGQWVLKTACAQNRAWHDQGFGALSMAVNLSPRQFREKDLVQRIAGTLAETGLAARFLDLEITEGMIMEHPDKAVAVLRELHALGLHMSVDDFGTGYSSLAYLKRFPVQKLKIDQSFVRDITTDPDDAGIVRAIVAMAKSLRLAVVAEGVETREQLAFLAQLGCDEYQGYYFSKPLPAAQFTGLLQGDSAMAQPLASRAA